MVRDIPLGGPVRPKSKGKGKAPAHVPPKSTARRSAARAFLDDEAGSGAEEATSSGSDTGSAWDESEEGGSDSTEGGAPLKRGRAVSPDDAVDDLSFSEDDDQSHTSDDDFAPNERDTFLLATGKARGRKRVKGWPGPKWQLKRWRRVTPEERDAVVGEGGLVWREARHILNEHTRREQDMLKALIQRAMAKTDAALAKERIPREPRLPPAVVSAAAGGWGAATSAAVAGGGESSLVAWKMEEQGDLAGLFDGDEERYDKANGFDGEIADMERVLLPEAEQTAHLFSAREQQDQVITRLEAVRDRLRKDSQAVRGEDTAVTGHSVCDLPMPLTQTDIMTPQLYRQLYPTALPEADIQEDDDREEISDDAVAAATQEAVDAGAEIEEDEEVATPPNSGGSPSAEATISKSPIRSQMENNPSASHSFGRVSGTPRRLRERATPRSGRDSASEMLARTSRSGKTNRSPHTTAADGSLTSPLGQRSTRSTAAVSHLPMGPASEGADAGRQIRSLEGSPPGQVEATADGANAPLEGVTSFISSFAGRFRGAFTSGEGESS